MEKTPANTLTIRAATSADSLELCSILNEIIQIGGTTAFQKPLNPIEFDQYFISSEYCLSCLLAETAGTVVAGFQALSCNVKLGADWGDIATFSRRNSGVKGVGTALFAETCSVAQQLGVTSLNATIRADNVVGLAYYTKMGFRDYAVIQGVPLIDGTPVDRISKRYDLPSAG